jgi:hypothetical protein
MEFGGDQFKFTIVAFWKQNDSGIYGRRQDMLVKYLAKHPRVHRIVHFDAPISRESLQSHLDLSHDRNLRHGNLIYTQTLGRALQLADTDNVTRRVFIYDDRGRGGVFPPEDELIPFVQDVLAEQGVAPERAIFWVWPTYFTFPRLVEACNPGLVVADIVDDHRRWDLSTRYRRRVEANYRDILRLTDIVITNCDPVREAMEEFGAAAQVVPNALEQSDELDDHGELPPDLRGIPRPIVGYVGNLDGRRLDLALLEHIVTSRPAWQLVLIGSVHADDAVLTLRRFPNVHILGVKRYEEAARYIRRFDVALIPHLKNALTDVMNPLKAFVYIALDVPVVSTDISNLGELRSAVVVAENQDACVEAIERCLAGDLPEATGTRHEFLRKHSWQVRVGQIMNLIERGWQRRHPYDFITPAGPSWQSQGVSPASRM